MKKEIASVMYSDLQGNGRIVCELCGSPNKNHYFKGKQICEECVKYIKSY